MWKSLFAIIMGIICTTTQSMDSRKIKNFNNDEKTLINELLNIEGALKKFKGNEGREKLLKKIKHLQTNLNDKNIKIECIDYVEKTFYYWWLNIPSFKKLLPGYFILLKSDTEAIQNLLHLLCPQKRTILPNHPLIKKIFLERSYGHCINIDSSSEQKVITKFKKKHNEPLPCNVSILYAITQSQPEVKNKLVGKLFQWLLDDQLIRFTHPWYFYLLSKDQKNLELHFSNEKKLFTIIETHNFFDIDDTHKESEIVVHQFEKLRDEDKQYLYESKLAQDISDIRNILGKSNEPVGNHYLTKKLTTLLTLKRYQRYKDSFLKSYILNPIILGELIALSENPDIPNQECLQTMIKISGLHLSDDDKLNKMMFEKKLDLHKIFEMCEETILEYKKPLRKKMFAILKQMKKVDADIMYQI
ncbi:MAG: hypothetical protein JW725_04480 [Candidatus Babeliaceae bacterium]|nr:hypothetical protein [Candidatus Babeliaceae bacterium]